jgi:hypothetical protein
MRTYAEARKRMAAEMRRAGWKIAKDAMDPLQRINFTKLVTILDHEERFLEQTFVSTLLALRGARASTKSDQGKITAEDVETALRMLGTAVPRQTEGTLSKASKGIIKDACGFCR